MHEKPIISQQGPFAVDLQAGTTYYFCTCGLSAKQPFCDGSHKGQSVLKSKPFTPDATQTYFLCGCKHSSTLPFCDGSHRADSLSAASTEQEPQPAAPMLVITCSLNPTSSGAHLAKYAVDHLTSQGQTVELIDLRDYNLPMANGHDQSAYDDPQVKVIHDKILKAGAIIIVAPIYNNNVAAVAKNLVELTTHAHKDVVSGKAWTGKIVGFMGTSGGRNSTWSFFPFINGMMIDVKIVVVPSFVMAIGEDVNTSGQIGDGIKKKIHALTSEMIRFTKALGAHSK